MQFHPVEPVLFTASEDGLIKLWNLDQKKDEKHNSGGTELEPVYTFRGHKGPVLCLVLSPTGDHLYTGGIDGNICCFNVPSSNGDPFDSYGKIYFLIKMSCQKLINHNLLHFVQNRLEKKDYALKLVSSFRRNGTLDA